MASETYKPEAPQASSKVSERMMWLSGHRVKVRLRYGELGQVGSEEFISTYLDCYCMGRAYFFLFETGGKKRLVQTDHVVDLTET